MAACSKPLAVFNSSYDDWGLSVLNAPERRDLLEILDDRHGRASSIVRAYHSQVHHGVDHPVRHYTATKRANELMARAYSHLFQLPTTGLRFTVYGPWGRPDMAMFIFASAIVQRRAIRLFNYGKMRRDFSYVDDVTETVVRLLDRIPLPAQYPQDETDPAARTAPWKSIMLATTGPWKSLALSSCLKLNSASRQLRNLLQCSPATSRRLARISRTS